MATLRLIPTGRKRRATVTTAALLAAAATAGAQVPTGTPAGTPGGTPAGARAADTTRRAMTPGDSAVRTVRDTGITPVADQARGVDAEIRIAVYELLQNQEIPALSRLEFLSQSPVALTDANAAGRALRGREDLTFVLAEAYYRLGMDSLFRRTAETAISGGSARYTPVLRAQLLLEAYRSGDFARAASMAQQVTGQELRGLGPLVAGLAAYQSRNYAAARSAFATAQQGGEPYASYAKYMDALTMLRGDSAQTGPALAALNALAQSASGEFADQVRLTAAEIAYESGQFDQAAQLAGQVQPTSGLGAQALLTRAWALFKANQIGPSGEAFGEFATRYPQLPERDEARLMAAQSLLQLGRTDEAARAFRAVADTAANEARGLQAGSQQAMAEAARALVQGRAAALLFLADPMSGKTVALQDNVGAETQVLARVVSDAPPAAQAADARATDIIALDDVGARVQSLAGASNAFPRRVLFTQTSATGNRAEFTRRSRALADADAAVALARHRLQEQLDANELQLATMRALQKYIGDQNNAFAQLAAQLKNVSDSLARLNVSLDATSARLRQIFQAQVNATRLVANENKAMIDSVRRVLGSAADERELQLLSIEAEIAATYGRVADVVEQGLGNALTKHPVFALRDSVRVRGDRMNALLTETQTLANNVQQTVASELARLEGELPGRAQQLRQVLASMEQRRTAAEAQLVAIVESELNARAGEMLASLRRDTEAAEFGSASAAFFRAIDAGRAEGSTTGSGAGGAGAAGAASAAVTGGAGSAAVAPAPAGSARP